jgi:hypothetical protein
VKECANYDLDPVYDAVRAVMDIVLAQVPDHGLRNHLAVGLIHMLLFSPTFGHIRYDERAGDFGVIGAIQDRDIRYAAILSGMKALSDLATPVSGISAYETERAD